MKTIGEQMKTKALLLLSIFIFTTAKVHAQDYDAASETGKAIEAAGAALTASNERATSRPAETMITEDIEIMQFLSTNPEAQKVPLAATLAFGRASQVTSITTRGCKKTNKGNEMYISLEMKLVGGGSGSESFYISCPK